MVMRIIQSKVEVNVSNGIIDMPKIMVAAPTPRHKTIEGMNQLSFILVVPAIITSASSGKMGKSIIRGK